MVRRKRKRVKHPCEVGWRVRWTKEFRLTAREMGIWRTVKAKIKDIEKRLRDPRYRRATLKQLKSEFSPYIVTFRRRRYVGYRMYFGKQTARGIYVVREDICRVWFVSLVPANSKRKYKHPSIRAD